MKVARYLSSSYLPALVAFILLTLGQGFAADSIKGEVMGGGAPIAKSTVTLWEASADVLTKAH